MSDDPFGAKTVWTQAAEQFEIQGIHDKRDIATVVGATPIRVMAEVFRIATVDPADIFDDQGNLLPIKQMPEAVRRCIASVDTETRWEGKDENAVQVTVRKIRFYSKEKCLELLMRHHRLLGERSPIEVVDNLVQLIQAARERHQQMIRGANGNP